ncbi:peptide/nickel transport system substrate-binding protein [Arboricoccus pini]|uniref:Peptide/nickel transport system substrate-binding protein n=1 Tax=Arboricoccus pini TaxID=1963835 RepID=A0A212RS13_9PROT|nr:ABC transporter substrate-binding protein [Arboricoccus pini]SNB75410.1 peptide/nickel transport system substrate-binding protein [Arboricoccus pini]
MLPLSRRVAMGLLGSAALLPAVSAKAATPKNVLIVVGEQGPNSLDTMLAAANDYTRMVDWQIYDRLVSHGTKQLPNGAIGYDKDVIKPELATSWEVSEDGKTMIFHLRQDATFHDGTPVTADDVKYSFDRAVSVGGFPTIQMAAGALTKPEQFSVVDKYTFKITFDVPNKLTLPDLAVPVPVIVNSKLAKAHATEKDPWALEWTQRNDAGGGAFKVQSWKPGDQLVFARFDDWKSGPKPQFERVVYRQVASPGTRRALLEKGDVDISVGLPPKDYAELAKAGKLKVIGTPIQNDLLFLDMNVKLKPFDNPKVREAIAYAIPYQQIMDAALYNRGVAMFGGDPAQPFDGSWPQPSKFSYDPDKAKKLLAEAGYPDGFSTTLSYDLSQATTREPIAILVQEALLKIGVKLELEKVPGASWFAKMGEKSMPFVIGEFYGWLDTPEYFFFWTFDGKNNSVFNTANYQNPELDALIDKARYEKDQAAYTGQIKQMTEIVMKDIPRIPLARLFYDVAMQSNIANYVYWFHTQMDFRTLGKN